jgi:hypothetical protein
MNTTQGIDWHEMLVPTGSLVELILRASIMYLLILAGFRIFRRDAGSLSVSDLLVVVLIADAAQNGMAGEYKSRRCRTRVRPHRVFVRFAVYGRAAVEAIVSAQPTSRQGASRMVRR